MQFIKKKNMRQGEELLYTPVLHWFYTVRHMVFSLPVFVVMLALWVNTDSLFIPSWLGGTEFTQEFILKTAIRGVFLTVVIITLLVFAWRIFLYLSTEYGVTNKRLIIKKGIIRVVTAEIPVDRIESIYCIQGIFGRIFRYGTICISGVGGMMPVFYMVSRPYALRRKIVEIIEKNKVITVIHGDIPGPKTIVKPEPVAREEPVYRYGTFVRVIPASDGTSGIG